MYSIIQQWKISALSISLALLLHLSKKTHLRSHWVSWTEQRDQCQKDGHTDSQLGRVNPFKKPTHPLSPGGLLAGTHMPV